MLATVKSEVVSCGGWRF